MGSRETKMAHAEYRKVRGLVLDFEADNERRKLRGTGLTPPLPNNRPSAFWRQFETIEVYRKKNQSKDGLDGLQEPLRRGLPKGKEYESWHLALDTVKGAKLTVASEIDHLNYVAGCILQGDRNGYLSMEDLAWIEEAPRHELPKGSIGEVLSFAYGIVREAKRKVFSELDRPECVMDSLKARITELPGEHIDKNIFK
jgi:hypothetical protein